MQYGGHTYCAKPLCHSPWLLAPAALENGQFAFHTSQHQLIQLNQRKSRKVCCRISLFRSRDQALTPSPSTSPTVSACEKWFPEKSSSSRSTKDTERIIFTTVPQKGGLHNARLNAHNSIAHAQKACRREISAQCLHTTCTVPVHWLVLVMTAFLPPNLLALFAPREPLPYFNPLDQLPHEKKPWLYSGVSAYLNEFEVRSELVTAIDTNYGCAKCFV